MFWRYGYWRDKTEAITLKGKEGIEKINSTIEKLRENPPKELAGIPTKVFKDYKFGTVTDFETGEESETGLPKSNVLYFEFDCDCAAWLAIRPSGTEPKLKFYYGLKGQSEEEADELIAKFGEATINMVNEMLK